MVKWVIEISKFRIKFTPKTTIKRHALTNFIVDNSRNCLIEAVLERLLDQAEMWEFRTYGSSSQDRSRGGLILILPPGKPLQYAIVITFKATNNVRLAKGLGIMSLRIKCDSHLVVNQVKSGSRESKTSQFKTY